MRIFVLIISIVLVSCSSNNKEIACPGGDPQPSGLVENQRTWDAGRLIDYSQKNGYKVDDRNLNKDPFSTLMKNEGKGLTTVIQAFGEPNDYSQVALLCQQCGTQDFTAEQIQMCQKSFPRLYTELTGLDLIKEDLDKIRAIEVGRTENLSLSQHEVRVRLKTYREKCDGKGGRLVRLDFFKK